MNTNCLTCGYPRNRHLTQTLSWRHDSGDGLRRVEFEQSDICPWLHNMTQPPWDTYLFRGRDWYAKSNQPEWSKRY